LALSLAEDGVDEEGEEGVALERVNSRHEDINTRLTDIGITAIRHEINRLSITAIQPVLWIHHTIILLL
jgi:hypothetical protein